MSDSLIIFINPHNIINNYKTNIHLSKLMSKNKNKINISKGLNINVLL